MSDQELAEYIPVHGDRLRIRKKIGQRGNEFSKRKNKLLKILHEKLEKRASGRKRPRDSSSDVEEETMRRPYGNKNAAKDTRQIEIGWIHKTYHRYKQVRAKTGGGTRKIMLPKDAMKENIMEEAKRLFFPDGVSPKGPLSKFEFDIWDFSERKFRDNITLNEMYEETKMPLLRFYLSTYEKGTEDISTKQSDPRTTGADSIEVHL
ncbi:uncharacterized protein LOC133174566 [Saccostrea echinata]|uniref:uncharacterized protein LOC133174566 n=1 Tax=Saccostrea echinata TaxID=191078 RepID=UPI002A7F14C8|nr:uncharacterized protein LOC133174566 [Saccostrea echinata]